MSTHDTPTLASDLAKYPVLLTPEDFHEITGINPNTQSVLRCRGTLGLPYRKLGRLVRYARADVLRWLEERAVTSR